MENIWNLLGLDGFEMGFNMEKKRILMGLDGFKMCFKMEKY